MLRALGIESHSRVGNFFYAIVTSRHFASSGRVMAPAQTDTLSITSPEVQPSASEALEIERSRQVLGADEKSLHTACDDGMIHIGGLNR